MKISLGIRGQLIAGIVLTTLAGIGLVGLVAVKLVETRAVYSEVSEAARTARFVELTLGRAAGPSPTSSRVERLTREILVESGVKDFRITRPGGRTVVSGGAYEGPPEGSEILPGPVGVRARIAGGGWLGVGTDLFVTAPVKAPGLAAGSELEFRVPLAGIREDLAGVRRFLVVYALAEAVVIIIFGVYYLSRSIVAPVKRLTEAASRISGGEIDERSPVEVDNEIGELAESFNAMADRLQGKIMALQRVNRELLETQQELVRSRTLAAVGGLAAGVAHEIGNPLGAVLGYLDILSKGAVDENQAREMVERATRELDRVDSMLKEFLALSREDQGPASEVDMNRVVEETAASVLVREDMEGVELRTSTAGGLPPVMAEEGRLRQVLSNLIINAAHALAENTGEKVVTVETGAEAETGEAGEQRRRKDDPPGLVPDREGRMVVFVRVADTGPGMDPETAEKVFEPFFTTKEVGRGTGLGLFVTRTIVDAYGGVIELDTGPGRGTTFTVKLPAAEGRRKG